jgi:hypothetical protein
MASGRPWRRASTAALLKALKQWSSDQPVVGGSGSGRTPAAGDDVQGFQGLECNFCIFKDLCATSLVEQLSGLCTVSLR